VTSEPRKIAIIGKSPSSIHQAPYGDESWEIWTLFDMNLRQEVPRFTRHFELHPLDWYRNKDDGYYDWLCGVRDVPVYLQRLDQKIPAGVLYPKDEIVERFGRYFTNTISWMIALAIHEGAAEIGLWGVDMAQHTEYEKQRPSCEYFIGLAVGAGIEVHVPDSSDLLKTRVLYGFETDSGQMRKKWRSKGDEIDQKLKQYRGERNQAALNAAFCEGAAEMHEYWGRYL
jgi:hypothetical protein